MGASRLAFVTGATGFLGYEIARQLVAAGYAVRALSRDGALPGELVSLGVTPVRGDLLDEGALARGVLGAELVQHVAADVNMWPARFALSHRTNVLGTRALLEASLAAGVRRFVYTSSASTLGKPWQSPPRERALVDETHAYNLAPLGMVYPHTKWLGEEEVLAATRRGLDAVITHPTAIFGPSDWKHNLLPLFRATRSLAGIAVPRGHRTTCDVRDVAAAHVALATEGRSGERYALGGEVLSVRALFTVLARATGGNPPRFELPDGAMLGLGRLLEGVSAVTGKAPAVSLEMARQSTWRVEISSDKAARELGYRSRPFAETVRDAVAWYRSEGLLPS
jgi:dihydroflavonol-4-reductase